VLVRSAARAAAPALSALPRLGGAAELRAVIAREGIAEAVIVDPGLTHRSLLEALDACERAGVVARLVPPIYDLLVDPRDLSTVGGVPLMRIDEARFHLASRALKRLFDVGVSAALLLLLSPLLLAIGAAIRLGSPGPALFFQTRAGKGGAPFRMWKFRTMVHDAERRLEEVVDVAGLAEPAFKLERDPRVTPLGARLRRFSLDELPQLVNVLKGDMSLVGPRPEEVRLTERYDVWQRRRLKVKPGITGLQQVEARGTLSQLHERVRLDIYYIRKQSLLLDLWILFRTFGVVLSGRGAT
jgi:exopolysaccharide biosynthesis polyprenyl glycosylphosphotransferase